MRMRIRAATVRILAVILAAGCAASDSNWRRTELYFGTSVPGGGGLVSDADWQAFLDQVVTPRFPDGFTVVQATGQYRESNGTLERDERTRIVIVLHPPRTLQEDQTKLDEIAREYVRRFHQDSVLRTDGDAQVQFVSVPATMPGAANP
jgi:uncharacterized protein DUF3574